MLLICGHGSKDINFKISFVNFVNKISKLFSNLKVDYCYIEINEPMIENSFERNAINFKHIIFLPALIFKGKHLKLDIISKLEILSKKFSTNVLIIDNIELVQSILSIYEKKISNEIFEENKYALITCSSFSKDKSLEETLQKYTQELSYKLRIPYFENFQFNKEQIVLDKLKLAIKNNKINKIILHPIFFFDGFLYKETIRKFEENFRNMIYITKPLLEEPEIIDIFREKILTKIKLFQ
tara:strand:- start:189 stop:908 length:720 start_codon:yes stop_codon:yes gene_type:complete